MIKLSRLATSVAAFALLAAVTSCGQQSEQQPQSHAQVPETNRQAEQPQAQQGQHSEPQQVQAGHAKQPEPPQPQATEPQQSFGQQGQNKAQPGLQSPNESSHQNGNQNTRENLSEDEIRKMQRALEQKGFRVGRLDGKLGPKTKRALNLFQRKQRIPRTGTPDERTLAALGIGGGASTSGQGQ